MTAPPTEYADSRTRDITPFEGLASARPRGLTFFISNA